MLYAYHKKQKAISIIILLEEIKSEWIRNYNWIWFDSRGNWAGIKWLKEKLVRALVAESI